MTKLPPNLHGTNKDDLLFGTTKSETFKGLRGNDTIYGNGGADVFNGGAGNDKMYGNKGVDKFYIVGDAGRDVITAGTGNDVVNLNKATSAYCTYAYYQDGDKAIWAGHVITDKFIIMHGRNTKQGVVLELSDTVTLVLGDTRITDDSERGNADMVFASKSQHVINGTAKHDELWGTTKSEQINGRAGNDEIYGNGGKDVFNGGLGNDKIYGFTGADTFNFYGNSGNDKVNGGSGVDTFNVMSKSATISIANYRLHEDILLWHGKTISEDYITNQGVDTKAGVVLTLKDEVTVLLGGVHIFTGEAIGDGGLWHPFADGGVINGTAKNDELLGTTKPEHINGRAGNDHIYGNGGKDTFNGGTGNDHIYGYTGDDTFKFTGVAGKDWATGGSGADTFNLNNAKSATLTIAYLQDDDLIYWHNHLMTDEEIAEKGLTYQKGTLMVDGNISIYLPGVHVRSSGGDDSVIARHEVSYALDGSGHHLTFADTHF